MKKIILILIGLTLVSCDFVKKQNKSKFDNISEKDTTCLNDIKDAKLDIQKGKLVYCYNLGSITHHSLRSEEELTSILKQINIEFRNVASSDIDYENQTHCYCEFMKEKITEKYGEKIIDSILVLSEKLYLKNSINDTLYYADCDKRPNYPNDNSEYQGEFSEVLQNELEKKITYPKGYIKKPNRNFSAFVDIYFYVNKKGEAKIQSFWFNFDIKTNNKFKNYLESEIKKYIKTENWTPAQIIGENVNSDMNLRFYLK